MYRKYSYKLIFIMTFLLIFLVCSANSIFAKNIETNKLYDLTLDQKDQKESFTVSVPEQCKAVMILRIKDYKVDSKYKRANVFFYQELDASNGDTQDGWETNLRYEKGWGTDEAYTNDLQIYTNPFGLPPSYDTGYYYNEVDGYNDHTAIRSSFNNLEKGSYSIELSHTSFSRTDNNDSINKDPFPVTVEIGLYYSDSIGGVYELINSELVPQDPDPAPEPEQPTTADKVIYRLYNSATGEHLYTPDAYEADQLSQLGWTNEGQGWTSPSSGTPVYRLFNPNSQDHLYTTDENEVDVLTTQNGWQADNNRQPLFYSGGNVSIYRLYNPSNGRHHLTKDEYEYSQLSGQGWQPEGIKLNCIS